MARNVPRHKRKEYTMAIEKAEVFVTSPGRNFVVFRITTTDGVVGLGDATLNGRELVAAKYLETIAPSLIGKNEDNIEDIWQYLYKGAYWKRGPVTMAAISAVDVALWDIKAKKAGVLTMSAGRRLPYRHSDVCPRLWCGFPEPVRFH